MRLSSLKQHVLAAFLWRLIYWNDKTIMCFIWFYSIHNYLGHLGCEIMFHEVFRITETFLYILQRRMSAVITGIAHRLLLFNMCWTDNKEISHTSRQRYCRDMCKISLWSAEYVMNKIITKFHWI